MTKAKICRNYGALISRIHKWLLIQHYHRCHDKENIFQVDSISVPSSASIHEKNAMKAFASVWQIKTGQDAFFQSDEVILASDIQRREIEAFFLHLTLA